MTITLSDRIRSMGGYNIKGDIYKDSSKKIYIIKTSFPGKRPINGSMNISYDSSKTIERVLIRNHLNDLFQGIEKEVNN